jgi:probable rRNA maturation factor
MSGTIHFFSEEISFRYRGKDKTRRWITNSANEEKVTAGEINIIFCDDTYLHKLNRKYLKHNTLTDIITFPILEEQGIISGDIFISFPRVKENAKIYQQRLLNELHRVIIHGVLHLIGYGDTSIIEKDEMRQKENFYLERLAEI